MEPELTQKESQLSGIIIKMLDDAKEDIQAIKGDIGDINIKLARLDHMEKLQVKVEDLEAWKNKMHGIVLALIFLNIILGTVIGIITLFNLS